MTFTNGLCVVGDRKWAYVYFRKDQQNLLDTFCFKVCITSRKGENELGFPQHLSQIIEKYRSRRQVDKSRQRTLYITNKARNCRSFVCVDRRLGNVDCLRSSFLNSKRP